MCSQTLNWMATGCRFRDLTKVAKQAEAVSASQKAGCECQGLGFIGTYQSGQNQSPGLGPEMCSQTQTWRVNSCRFEHLPKLTKRLPSAQAGNALPNTDLEGQRSSVLSNCQSGQNCSPGLGPEMYSQTQIWTDNRPESPSPFRARQCSSARNVYFRTAPETSDPQPAKRLKLQYVLETRMFRPTPSSEC